MRALSRFSRRNRSSLRSCPFSPSQSFSPRPHPSSRYRHPTNSRLRTRDKREQNESPVSCDSHIWKLALHSGTIWLCRRNYRDRPLFMWWWALVSIILTIPFRKLGREQGKYESSWERRVNLYLETTEETNKHSEEQKLVYRGLSPDQFRLFILEPGCDNEIRGRFVVEQIGQSVLQYESLSYHWGNTEKTVIIHCNDHELQISENLHDALRELRLPYSPRLLWVDALCINQDDVEERNRQVRRMRDIYQHADRVMIWLGKETQDVEGVFKLLNFVRESKTYQIRTKWRRLVFLVGFINAEISYQQFGRITPEFASTKAEEECWFRIGALLSRPWFHRLWILQEIVHAQRATVFMSGAIEMDWDDFETAIDRICWVAGGEDKLSDYALAATRTVKEIQKARKYEVNRERELFQMLLMASSSECTDPRDRIYAVLSLADDLDTFDPEGLLAPDYAHETTPEDIYRRFAVCCILGNKDLRLLSCANFTNAADHSLPSWIPDWRKISSEDMFIRFSDRIPFSAGLPTLFTFGIDSSPEILDDSLSLSAKRVDSIRLVVDTAARAEQYLDRSLVVDRIFIAQAIQYINQVGDPANPEQAEKFADMIMAGKEIPNLDFYRYMVCGLTQDGYPASMLCIARLRSFYPGLMKALDVPIPGENGWIITNYFRQWFIDGDPEKSWKFDRIADRFGRWTKHRAMGLTDAGRMCWLPPDAKEGDLVYIVPGCQVPYVFRREDSGKYTLVGEAYIHGIMLGEETPKTRRELERLTIV